MDAFENPGISARVMTSEAARDTKYSYENGCASEGVAITAQGMIETHPQKITPPQNGNPSCDLLFLMSIPDLVKLVRMRRDHTTPFHRQPEQGEPVSGLLALI